MRYYTPFLFLGVLSIFNTLVFAESPEEIQIFKKYFFEKFYHSESDKNLISSVIEEMFTWQEPTIPTSEITTIVAFAFGNRILPNGNRTPGPVNEQMADLAVHLHQQSQAQIYAQWEIAEAIGSRVPKHHLTTIYPILDDRSNVIYLSTVGVADAVRNQASKNGIELGKVAIIGFHDHVRRCLEVSRNIGMDAYMPEGLTMPSHYDEESGQPWTRNRFCYLEHELHRRLKQCNSSW